jgi:hypothetical protein
MGGGQRLEAEQGGGNGSGRREGPEARLEMMMEVARNDDDRGKVEEGHVVGHGRGRAPPVTR